LSREGLDSYLAELHARLAAQAEEGRLAIRVQLATLGEASVPSGLSSADAQAFEQRLRAQAAVLQDQHDAIPTEFDLAHHEAGATEAQFACADHRNGDDWLATVHEADCSGRDDCGCST